MRWLFNLAYALLLLAVSPRLVYRGLTTGRYRQGLVQKLLGARPTDLTHAATLSHKTIWLHGVSVGEVQLLKPLMMSLREMNPQTRFVISTTTRTGMELAERLFPDTQRIYFPLDFSWAVLRAMRTVDPTLIVLGELELWPNFVAAAKRRGVPIVVANARLSEKSFRGYQRFSWLTRSMFDSLSLVTAQDATYAERFVQCGVQQSRLVVTGSLKFDNVNFDRQCQQVEQFRNLVGLKPDHRVWLVGSTQSPEERVAATAFMSLKKTHRELRMIVVPRHPERFESVHQELVQLGLEPILRSHLKTALGGEDWQVLLVDTVGELRWWWGLANLALVGGSFGNRGGQNMLEPAAYGADVFFGPNTSNFRDISQLLLDAGAATRLQTLDEILPWVTSQLFDPEPGRVRGQKAQELVRQHQGALAKTTMAIQKLLESRPESAR